MDAVAGYDAVGKVRRILKCGIIRSEHDVAKYCEFRVDQRWAVDRRDHWHLDIEMIHQQVLGVAVDVVPRGGPDAGGLRNAVAPDGDAAAGAGVDLGAKRVAGAGYDYAAVVAIARDVVEGIRQFLMRSHAPFEFGPVGMKRHLEDPVVP